jgi:hypothetical protein
VEVWEPTLAGLCEKLLESVACTGQPQDQKYMTLEQRHRSMPKKMRDMFGIARLRAGQVTRFATSRNGATRWQRRRQA